MELYPQAVQIIATDDPGNEGKFILREENLTPIIQKIPADMKVAVVSVVGAFRTGKSFLLNLFLRYLRHGDPADLSEAWMTAEGEELSEGNLNNGWSLVEGTEVSQSEGNPKMSFGWRGGRDRQTTGIWMWSEPIFRTIQGESVAVLLMDTQGMFDNETSMTLTAQIFGLSTLVSSLLIYNVDKRIQEDNLQHLALFSEYGRMTLLPKNESIRQLGERVLERSNSVRSTLKAEKPAEKEESEEGASGGEGADKEAEVNAPEANAEGKGEAPKEHDAVSGAGDVGAGSKPFQHLQFLVRDWQNFDDLPDPSSPATMDTFSPLLKEMGSYLSEVLKSRVLSDLQSTREQILRCFEQVDCFLLPHPGFEVTKKSYTGAVGKIDPMFRMMMNFYIRRVFHDLLHAKQVRGICVTGSELMMYLKIYVSMFVEGGDGEGGGFPQAMTVLDATAQGNNRVALDRALGKYKSMMEGEGGVGEGASYLPLPQFNDKHEAAQKESIRVFESIATMGSELKIEETKTELLDTISREVVRYKEVNALRNPHKDLEYYVVPLAIAAISWVLSVLVDISCSHDVCEKIEDTFVNIYMFVVVAGLVVCYKQVAQAWGVLKGLAMPFIQSQLDKQKVQ